MRDSTPAFSRRIQTWLWTARWRSRPLIVRSVVVLLRYIYALTRDLSIGQVTLHAVSLVYTVLLSIVPVLALSFSLLKGLGVHRNQDVISLIEQFMQPLGPKGTEITQNILSFVENVRGDLLGLFGVLFLFFIAISLIRKVEFSFNSIWEIARVKNFAKRLTEYIGALVIAPTLMLSALALGTMISSHHLTQQVSQIEPIGFMLQNFGKVVPTLLVAATFTFLYKFIPNTQVKLKHALFGGLIAGITWSLVGFIFAGFVANSSVRYDAIYSGFAILIMFMIWLYISCLILLLGARLVFYMSHPQQLKYGSVQVVLSPMQELSFASEIMLQVSKDFETGSQNWNTDALSRFYQLPSNNIAKMLERLEKKQLLRRDEQGFLFPAKQPAKITLNQIAEALFTHPNWSGVQRFDTRLKAALEKVELALLHSLDEKNLGEILKSDLKTEE